MKNDLSPISSACLQFLPALARMLLRSGLNCRQFIELAKVAYVRVVTEDFGRSGRPTNVSRTAMLTGLTRVAVRKTREFSALPSSTPSSDRRLYSLTALLKDWHHDSAFLRGDGQPSPLHMEEGSPTFGDLVHRHFGDVAVKTVLKELLDVGSVVMAGDGCVRVVRDYHMLPPVPEQHAERAGLLLSDFIQTVGHNMNRVPSEAPRFESRTTFADVPSHKRDAFYALLEKEASAMSARLYQWLREQHAAEPEAQTVRMGVGIYQIHGGESDPSSQQGEEA